MSHDYSYAGPVRTIKLERSLVMKTGFSRKEAARTFAGKMEMDETGQVLEMITAKKRTVFKYDNYGNPIEEIHFSKEGEILSQEVSRYGENGMMIRKDTLNSVGDPVESIKYSFDHEREMLVEYSANRVVMRKYDSSGKLTLECVYIDDRLDMIINYDYKGDLLTEKLYKNSADKIIRRFFYEYGERALLIREKCINADDVVTTHNVYEYDDHDKYNWLKRTTFAVQEDSKKVKEIPIEVLYREISYGREGQGIMQRTAENLDKAEPLKSQSEEAVDLAPVDKPEIDRVSSFYEEPESPMPANQFAKLSIEQPSENFSNDKAIDYSSKIFKADPQSQVDDQALPEPFSKLPETPSKEPRIDDPKPNDNELRFPNGLYRGEMNGEEMEGEGVFLYDNGDHYHGSFKEGKLNGQGSMTWSDGRFYKGDFLAGALHGKGECRWANGDLYKGEFKEGKMHGRGIFKWSDGSSFEGLFENNQRTRQGMIEDPKFSS